MADPLTPAELAALKASLTLANSVDDIEEVEDDGEREKIHDASSAVWQSIPALLATIEALTAERDEHVRANTRLREDAGCNKSLVAERDALRREVEEVVRAINDYFPNPVPANAMSPYESVLRVFAARNARKADAPSAGGQA